MTNATKTRPSPFTTKREAIAWATQNEAFVKEFNGTTDADELAVIESLKPKPRARGKVVKLSRVLRSFGGEPPGGWGDEDKV